MRVDVDNSDDFGTLVFDLDTKKEIPYVVRADDESGEYEAYQTNPDGTIYEDPQTGETAFVILHARLLLVRHGEEVPAGFQRWEKSYRQAGSKE